VKNELKHYDESFKSNFGRFPNRYEKEPMRPLYVYYKKLKQAISFKEANPNENIEIKPNDNNNSINSNLKQSKQIYDSQELLTKQSEDTINNKNQSNNNKKITSSIGSINSSLEYPNSLNNTNNLLNSNVNLDLNNVKEKKLKELYKRKVELRTVLQK